MSRLLPLLITISSITFISWLAQGANPHLDDPYCRQYTVARDTVPNAPRYGDFITDPNYNPFDLDDPGIIERNVEYDPETGNYIVTEKIGDENYRPPMYLTFEEYLQYRRKQEETDYFQRLAGYGDGEQGNASLDPMEQLDVEQEPLERLFGGTTVDIRPQGTVDLTFGVDYQKLDNPILTQRQRVQTVFDFDMDIQMSVTGKVGEKLNLSTNFNTNATFDFDNQIKLNYNSDLFSEDEILKKIEAGNVSLPLRGQLIQGAQSLFGLKTELQFGHLRLTAIGSQQQSQRENIQIEGGAQLQEFEVRADQYDENRHFFLSFYNRQTFEGNLENLPQVRSLFKLENIEVWITNNRNEVDDVRDIVAFSDLGEPQRLVSPDEVNPSANPPLDARRLPLPDNESNDLYQRLLGRPAVREIDQAVSILQSSEFGLQQARDFEKVSARKLQPSEYTINPELGFISLNINVQPNQVVGVAYQYSYNGENYKVGELSVNTESAEPDSSLNVLFVKMLKSTTQRTDIPTWDLMMKNVYSIGAFQVNRNDFRLDVFYDDPGRGQKRFLPTSNLAGQPLLRVFNLDQLNIQGDPSPDGVFDFVPGTTINLQNGRVMFPVLEPFGESLAEQIDDPAERERYVYNELYDSTLFLAQEFQEKNRYVIKGSYKSSVASEISLGAFNIPPGSVRVTAGGQILQEGRDYEIDYNIGRVRILNDAILNSGVPVNVSYEDNALFGLQTKTMLGLRADYEVDENFQIGATALKLFERPFTQKVNIGDDPINNTMYGLDMNLSREAPWLTKAVDAIPGISTKAPSNISVSAEGALLRPGHSRAINQANDDEGGVVYVDDFEGTASTFDLRQPVANWFLASVPQGDVDDVTGLPLFPESDLVNDLRYGSNRAKLSWYRIDRIVRTEQDAQNPYASLVPRQEVFPNAQIPPNEFADIQTFDLTYCPDVRGPYNFDVPDGYSGISAGVTTEGSDLKLRDPQSRWGGIMRALNTNDFQAANIEFLEFWVLSPFLDEENPMEPAENYEEKQGDLYINLGNVSEDILRDSRKFFENGLPSPGNPDRRVDTTTWSAVPLSQQITRAFDNDEGTREVQDVGLDGLDNTAETRQYADYINQVRSINTMVDLTDPAGDDFVFYRDQRFESENVDVIRRYQDMNNPEGNSAENTGGQFLNSATNIPDAEDLDQDNTLNETESYFRYRIPLRADPGNPRNLSPNTPFVTDRIEADNGRVWYRFRVPLNTPLAKRIGGIRDFRSIRFMRMYLKGMEEKTTLRFARLELVRNQWRRYTQELTEENAAPCDAPTTFDVDAVNIEENSNREPFNYVIPEGIVREQSIGVFNTQQNEQALTLVAEEICDGDARAAFKNINLDMRVYERLKMFVHAEDLEGEDLEDGDLSMFVRLGSDITQNYYEYEIPLTFSKEENLPAVPNNQAPPPEYKSEVWREENTLDVPLDLFVDLKLQRNELNASLTEEFVQDLEENIPGLPRKVKVKGNPNLGFVKIAMLGIRNSQGGQNTNPVGAEVWANELRLTGLDERGGAAAVARVDMQLADFANVTVAGNYSSIGFGQIDQKVQERAREEVVGYDIAASMELGKFFPQNWGIRLPFYVQHSRTVSSPEFDPYDLDVTLDDKLNKANTPNERDSIRANAQDVSKLTSVNLTNVRKERTNNNKKPKPWDIENISASYSYTRAEEQDPIIEFDRREQHTGSLDYGFSRQAKYVEPFKGIEAGALELLSRFNFNPLPTSVAVSTQLDREFNTTRYRFTGLDDRFNTFYNKRFSWDRTYNLQWDLTRSLKFNFTANNEAVIDEPNEEDLIEDGFNLTEIDQIRKDSIWENIQRFGRTKNYNHSFQVNYQLPIRYIPGLDWVDVKTTYRGEFRWTAAALNTDSLGNIIQNGQNIQVNSDFNLESLYNKIPYLRKINQGSSGRGRGRRTAPQQRRRRDRSADDEEAEEDKKDGQPSTLEKVLIRPLMSLRRVRFNYSEDRRTVVPGFLPQTNILGLSPGFDAPGLDFVAGYQPRIRNLSEAQYGVPGVDWLADAADRGWISGSLFLNREVTQDYTQKYDGQATLEPFRDFRIDVNLSREFTENHTEFFKDTVGNGNFVHAVPKDFGSLTVTYSALNTLFDDDKGQIIELFNRFEENRVIISQRLGNGEPHQDSILATQGFEKGYGRTQQEVLIPAFIAAYSGEDARNVSLNIFDVAPDLNWRLTYNGLARVPLFSELFQNFSLTHAYRSTLTINRFGTGLDFLRTRDQGAVNEINGNFYPRLEIPEIIIQEGFQPMLGLDATLKNGMSFSVQYAKSRTLGMSFVSNQLSETQSTQIDVGFGYLVRNLDIPFLTGSNNQKKDDSGGDLLGGLGGGGNSARRGGSRLKAQDLDINFSLSLRDDVTFNHLLDQDIIEPTRGSYSLQFSPTAEYQLNQRISLTAFFEYNRNVPKTSAGFPRTTSAGGFRLRFNLN